MGLDGGPLECRAPPAGFRISRVACHRMSRACMATVATVDHRRRSMTNVCERRLGRRPGSRCDHRRDDSRIRLQGCRTVPMTLLPCERVRDERRAGHRGDGGKRRVQLDGKDRMGFMRFPDNSHRRPRMVVIAHLSPTGRSQPVMIWQLIRSMRSNRRRGMSCEPA
jgi:hypothetical protein